MTPYQRVMNLVFHDSIGKSMEVYIDDVVLKSIDVGQHLADLEQAL